MKLWNLQTFTMHFYLIAANFKNKTRLKIKKKKKIQPVSFENSRNLWDQRIIRVRITEQGAHRQQNLYF